MPISDVETITLAPIPASVYVACPADWCPAFAVQRLVWLKQVAVGVVAIPQLMCQTCHSVLNVPLWPDVEEAPVPKITIHGGPSNLAADGPLPEPVKAEPVETPVAEAAPAETETAAETPAPAKTAAKKTTARKKTGDS